MKKNLLLMIILMSVLIVSCMSKKERIRRSTETFVPQVRDYVMRQDNINDTDKKMVKNLFLLIEDVLADTLNVKHDEEIKPLLSA